jgi:hypothetical protein
MANKIAQNPRSLKTFGVAGLLFDQCKIYYDSLFCARHIGRVSDLLVAQLRSKGIIHDDLRLRVILLRSLYEAYCIQGKKELKKGESLKDPLVIECGVDSEKLAIGVAFQIEAERSFDVEQLKQSVEQGTPSEDALTRLLRELFLDSNHLVFRANASRVEVVSLMSLEASDEHSFEAVLLGAPEKKSALSGEYIELGDLDYQTLLKNEAIAVDLKAPATGELLAQQGSSELSEAVRLKGTASASGSSTKISGVTSDLGSDKLVVASGQANQEQNASRELQLYMQRTEELQNRIRELEKQASQVAVGGVHAAAQSSSVSSAAPVVSEEKGIVRELIEKVWPLKRAAKPVVPPPSPVPVAAALAAEAAANRAPEKEAVSKEVPAEPEAEGDNSTAGLEVRKLVNDEVGFIENTLKKVEEESQVLKKDLAPKAQKWVEGMVGDLIGEKARLNDLGKKLSVSVRQKEVEFRNKEIKLQEEIRKRDESVRQRTHAYNRAREQINQLTSQLERAKAGVQTNGEELQSKQRYAMSQKLLSQAKEENQEHIKKIEELRDQLASVQNASKEKKSTGDFIALKAKFDRVVKQAEEFKRANQQLLEKLNEATRPKPAALNPDDLKRRLDVSMKLAASYQKDSEKLKLKIEDYVREENRLKAELARAHAALRATAKKAPAGDSGTDQAA